MVKGGEFVNSFSLYDKTSSFSGIYVFFLVNRLQMLYFLFIMPTILTHPYMIWGIILVGMLSQLNLMVLSKWVSSDHASKGYQGFVQIFGDWLVRLFTFFGVILMLVKVVVLTLGYVEIIHQLVFPSMNANWLVVFIMVICCYVASLGMSNSIRFVVIAFLCTIWMIVLFYPFFFPEIASLHDLYPLVPTEWSKESWRGLLLIWSSFSGPEYIVCLVPWLKSKENLVRYFTYANTLSVLEYVLLFMGSLFFFGSEYLSKSKFPVATMAKYLQTPVFERIDIIMVSLQVFNLVFAVSIFLLCIYGAYRIIRKKSQNQPTRKGLQFTCLVLIVGLIATNKWIWQEDHQSLLLNLQIWCGSFTYLLVPSLLFISSKRKGRM